MHELQSILLTKIPRLGELTFGCKIIATPNESSFEREYTFIRLAHVWGKLDVVTAWVAEENNWVSIHEILGHPFTHADILEALGEDWAMDGAYYLLQNDGAGSFEAVVLETEEGERNIILPQNLSDLSLPEYEETRKQLIQLLTK